MWVKRVCLISSLVALAGCTTIAGPQGQYIGDIACSGKGTVTIQGMGFSGTVMAECDPDEKNPGFHFSQGRQRLPVPAPAVKE